MFDIFSCENGPSRRYYQLHYAYHISQSVPPLLRLIQHDQKEPMFPIQVRGPNIGEALFIPSIGCPSLLFRGAVSQYLVVSDTPLLQVWSGRDPRQTTPAPLLSHWLPPTHCSFCGDLQPLNRHNTDSSHGLSSLRARVTCEVPKPRRTRSLSRLLWISCVGVLPSCL